METQHRNNSEFDDDLAAVAQSTIDRMIQYPASKRGMRKTFYEQDWQFLARQLQRVRDGEMKDTI